MPSKTRKGIIAAFLMMSIVFTVIIGYSTNLYYSVYETIRNFDASIPKLIIEIANSSYILIKTPVTIQNPSNCMLEVTEIREGLHLQGEFISTGSLHTFGKPIQIHGNSVVNVTIDIEIPPHKMEFVSANLEESWIADIRIFLRAPIAGIFSWQKSWFISEVTKT